MNAMPMARRDAVVWSDDPDADWDDAADKADKAETSAPQIVRVRPASKKVSEAQAKKDDRKSTKPCAKDDDAEDKSADDDDAADAAASGEANTDSGTATDADTDDDPHVDADDTEDFDTSTAEDTDDREDNDDEDRTSPDVAAEDLTAEDLASEDGETTAATDDADDDAKAEAEALSQHIADAVADAPLVVNISPQMLAPFRGDRPALADDDEEVPASLTDWVKDSLSSFGVIEVPETWDLDDSGLGELIMTTANPIIERWIETHLKGLIESAVHDYILMRFNKPAEKS